MSDQITCKHKSIHPREQPNFKASADLDPSPSRQLQGQLISNKALRIL